MEKRAVTLFTMLLTLAVLSGVVVLYMVEDLHKVAQQFGVVSDTTAEHGQSVLSLLRDDSQMFEPAVQNDMLRNHQLRLELPANVAASSVAFETDYMNRTCMVTIPNINSMYFYDYPMVGTPDHIEDLYFDQGENKGSIIIRTDSVFEFSTISEGRYIYLDLQEPRDIYDYIVVLDAGHGGSDVGAYKKEIAEKDLNLSILLKMKEILAADGENIGVYYTRTDDRNVSLQARADLANTLKADLFLSIHNNSTSSGRMSGIHGTEVMYCVSDRTGESKKFAQRVLSHLLTDLESDSKGLIAGDEIYIVRTAEMPVALAEIGFMTNEAELKKLSSEEYQQKAARAMVDAIYEMLGIVR